jgi:hypothetical protein
VLFYVLLVSIVLFYVFFVCKCVLYYCHRVANQLQLNISYNISYQITYNNDTSILHVECYRNIIAALNIMLSILWPEHDTYRRRTHQYLAQRLDLSGSKTSTLHVCIHATTHIAHSCILINFSQKYVNIGQAVAQLV